MKSEAINIEKFAKGLAEYVQKRDRESREFFNSKEFSGLMKIIKNTPIDEEALRYKTQIVEGLTSGKYTRVCDAVFHNLDSQAKEDLESPFPKYSIDYQGVRFHLMIGQGAAYWSEPLS